MSLIRVDLDYPIEDGLQITFKAPCNSKQATGLKIYYPVITDSGESTTSTTFTFGDSATYNISGTEHLFVTGAYVSVILDTTNNRAYLQNGDTNHYLESKIATLESDLTSKLNTYVRPNLLDNWYFVGGGSQQDGGRFPVNQKGLTTYQGEQYCVDRWLLSHSSAQAALRANCIRLTASSSANAFLSQTIENGFNNLKGQTVTWSVLTTSGLATLSGVVPTTAPSSGDTTIISLNSQIPNSNSCWLALGSDGVLFVQIGIRAGYQMDIIATKLEIGDTQTLAHQKNSAWVLNEIPNFEQELAKCQRFDFWVKNTSSSAKYAYAIGMTIHNSASFVNAVAYTPVPMRTLPAVSHASCDVYRFIDGSRVSIADSASFSAFSAVENALGLSIKADTGMTADETVLIEILPGGYIRFDANL